MSAVDLDRVRALMVELETLDAINRELHAANDGIGNLAHTAADSAVALLSLVPFANSDARALGFLSDALDAGNATMRQALELQATLRRIADGLDARLDVLRVAVASVKAPE